MIKLVVSDIDGTLLEDGGHELNPELFEVILKLREKGMQFAAASGRQWASIEQVFDPIKEKIFYLSDNGAYVGCHGRQLIAYENGDIDLADLNASLLSQYQTNYADEITAYHPLGTSFISMNLKDQYLSDVNVRKAISLAINREELVSAVLNGAGIPATSYLNNGIPGHDDSLSVYEYDPEQAKALAAAAGVTL